MVGTVGSGCIPLKTAPWDPAILRQSVFCRAVRPCDVVRPVYPVNISTEQYLHIWFNEWSLWFCCGDVTEVAVLSAVGWQFGYSIRVYMRNLAGWSAVCTVGKDLACELLTFFCFYAALAAISWGSTCRGSLSWVVFNWELLQVGGLNACRSNVCG